MAIKVAIADDHDLMRAGIRKLVEDEFCEVILEAQNGIELLEKLPENVPDIILMDINMPKLNGINATERVVKSYPNVRIIALTALEDELNTIRMLRSGARAYLLKSSSADELRKAIREVHESGYHFSEMVSGRLIQSLNGELVDLNSTDLSELSDREIEFISFLCTELTNKEIADRMCVSPRTSEGWSKALCERLGVKSRVGIVLYAFRNGLVK